MNEIVLPSASATLQRTSSTQPLGQLGQALFGWSTAVIFEILRRAMTTIRSEEGRR